ncbi:uncharacterized protein LOC133538076 [Nerophis ophidion]|uniref:uncharacterized protein LOC133538076 n=1 Tax=Nerophis ophidion TaxID=159077 RepID=UPI002ADF6907|nr:uncharacterized protein LOC133538076 [Nerophis ophidion]
MEYILILVYLMFTGSSVSEQVVIYVLKGQEINLEPSYHGEPNEIYWTQNGKNVVYFDGMLEIVFQPYENRVTLDWDSTMLTIQNATYEHSGNYYLEIKVNKERRYFQYKIEVIDKVSTPNIRCEMMDTYQATLMCSTESKHSHLLEFKWRSGGNKQTAPNLTISLSDNLDQIHVCEFSNPLTNARATFTAKDCLSGNISMARMVGIMASIFAGVLIVLIIFKFDYSKKLQGFIHHLYLQMRETIMEKNNTKNPHKLWFLESYDELKPYGITITTCTDIFSNIILWMKADNTNSHPTVFLNHFLDTVTRIGGCPQRLMAEPSRENQHITTTQTFLRRNHTDWYAGHRSVIDGCIISPQLLFRIMSTNWKYYFQTLKDSGHFSGSYLDKSLIQFCFLNIIQDGLDEFVRINN